VRFIFCTNPHFNLKVDGADKEHFVVCANKTRIAVHLLKQFSLA